MWDIIPNVADTGKQALISFIFKHTLYNACFHDHRPDKLVVYSSKVHPGYYCETSLLEDSPVSSRIAIALMGK